MIGLLLGGIASAILLVQAQNVFVHPTLCLTYQQDEMHINKGAYIIPLIRDISTSCHQSECAHLANGTDYRGRLSTTKSGIPCQNWRAEEPHKPNLEKKDYEDHDLESNYCRNPTKNKGGVWCYTTKEVPRWEFCDLPQCSKTTAKWMHTLFKDYDDSTTPESFLNSRRKRGIGFLLGTAISAIKIAQGISNSIKLQRLHDTVTYMGNNQHAIKRTLQSLQSSVTTLETDMKQSFLAVKDLDEKTTAISNRMACQLNQIKLNNLMDSLSHGKITTDILPPENLIHLLSQNAGLKDSIYIKYPHLIYKLGEVEILDLDPEEGILTILLFIPHINQNPDGFTYEPLLVPRFQVEGKESLLEKFPKMPTLIDHNPHLISPKGRGMMGLKENSCEQLHSFKVCKLANHFDNQLVKCSNALLQNTTDQDILEQVCSYTVVRQPWQQSSYTDESSTHVLIFTNEDVQGTTKDGIFTIANKHENPGCILVNKLAMHELTIGDKFFELNVRSDALREHSNTNRLLQNLCPHPTKLVDPSPWINDPVAIAALVIGAVDIVAIISFVIYQRFRHNRAT